MIRLVAGLLVLATPARAAEGGEAFFTFSNAEFVVLVGFLLFLGTIAYYRVPRRVGGMLDERAKRIRSELDEARTLREEAQSILASYERRQAEAREQSERIVAQARQGAKEAAEQARADLDASIERRLQAADDRIASAEAAAVREVRERAIEVAVAAAGEVIAETMTASDADRLIADSISEVEARLH